MKQRIRGLLKESVDEKKFRFLQRYIQQHYSEPYSIDHHEFKDGTVYKNFTFRITGMEYKTYPDQHPWIVIDADVLNIDVEYIKSSYDTYYQFQRGGKARLLIKHTLRDAILNLINLDMNYIHVNLDDSQIEHHYEK